MICQLTSKSHNSHGKSGPLVFQSSDVSHTRSVPARGEARDEDVVVVFRSGTSQWVSETLAEVLALLHRADVLDRQRTMEMFLQYRVLEANKTGTWEHPLTVPKPEPVAEVKT